MTTSYNTDKHITTQIECRMLTQVSVAELVGLLAEIEYAICPDNCYDYKGHDGFHGLYHARRIGLICCKEGLQYSDVDVKNTNVKKLQRLRETYLVCNVGEDGLNRIWEF